MKPLLSKRQHFILENMDVLSQKKMAEMLGIPVSTVNVLTREIKIANGQPLKKYEGGKHEKRQANEPKTEFKRPAAVYSNQSIYDQYK